MNQSSFRIAIFAGFLAVGVLAATAFADWTEDFSGPLTNWDVYTFDPFIPYGGSSISMGVVDGKLVFDAHLPNPAAPVGDTNNAAGYSAAILNDPAFSDAEDVEITCVVELGGTTEQLYAGILARAQDIEEVPGQILIGGSAYAYLISGYDHASSNSGAEVGLYKLQNHQDISLQLVRLDETYDTRVEEEPIYLKMKVTTNEYGLPRIEGMMSFSANFSDPFGIIDYVDEGAKGDPVVGAGKVGVIGFNDYEPELAQPASATFDNLVIITEFLELGDANGDGFVNSADLDIVRANWGTSVTPGNAAMGDLSGDGMVNSADLDLVRANWGNVYAAAVPEPGLCVLAALALLGIGLRLQKR